MGVVIGEERAADAADIFLRTFAFRQGALEELVDAVADEVLVGLDGVGGEIGLGEGVIGAVGEVGDGVEQRAV